MVAISLWTQKGPHQGTCDVCKEQTEVVDVIIDWMGYTVCETCEQRVIEHVIRRMPK